MNMPSPTRVRVAGPLQPYAVGFRQELSRLGYSSSPAAVSYTHLRAHETVLDLVCRLLLEKKKSLHNM